MPADKLLDILHIVTAFRRVMIASSTVVKTSTLTRMAAPAVFMPTSSMVKQTDRLLLSTTGVQPAMARALKRLVLGPMPPLKV